MLNQASLTIRLHPDDDVLIARAQLVGGTKLIDENVTVAGLVPPGHKVATRAIKAGAPVRRYNQIIGFASRDIVPGEHVHLHNLAMGTFDRDYAFGADAKPTQYVAKPATFMGIVRADARADFSLEGRTRRPPRDRMNALLSFLYAMLMNDCRSAIESVGLDPQLGFLHAVRPGRAALALDLMEEFRHQADRLALTPAERRSWWRGKNASRKSCRIPCWKRPCRSA